MALPIQDRERPVSLVVCKTGADHPVDALHDPSRLGVLHSACYVAAMAAWYAFLGTAMVYRHVHFTVQAVSGVLPALVANLTRGHFNPHMIIIIACVSLACCYILRIADVLCIALLTGNWL